MIGLTDQQGVALEHAATTPPRVVNPRTKEMFVLLRVDEYERLKEEYDDSPWTREELQALAWEVAERTDWEEATPVRASADRGRAQHLLCPDCRERVVEQGRMRCGSPLLGKRQRC